ncbi:MAG: hypothetical protein MUF87_07950 [Anaerolineae bacterium]|jgi:hypothetical protein|nr:hypothetical protein [Anaerolineae bacterium]
MIPNRAENVKKWTYEELWLILMRQFKRLSFERGVEITDVTARALAAQAAQRAPVDAIADPIRQVLIAIVEESVNVLGQWQLTYEQALQTTMNEMHGWETTADFLSLANEKGNAELRIAAGSALLAGLGDARYARYLWQTYQHGRHDPEDVDAIVAWRALLFAAGIAEDDPQAIEKAENFRQKL